MSAAQLALRACSSPSPLKVSGALPIGNGMGNEVSENQWQRNSTAEFPPGKAPVLDDDESFGATHE
jgi:hypothetical protein